MELPHNLIHEVKNGSAVLFLGAGAAMGARCKDGTTMLGVSALISKLSDRFLGGEVKTYSLASVAELAISESDLVTVQNFVADLFTIYQPANFHLKIPLFKWKSIYTTNYDFIIERSYAAMANSLQKLVPIYSSSDRVDTLIKTESHLPFVKLHGCISKIDESSPPLILTIDQYVTHREKRESLFERLRHLGSSQPVIFVGHSLEDPDIRQILHEISHITVSRPRFYAVMPEFSDMQMRLWEGRRITLIKGTFEQFLNTLETKITSIERQFVAKDRSHEIERKFISNEFQLTSSTLETLQSQLIYLHGGMAVSTCTPKSFYNGYSKGWGGIQNDFDVRRNICDEIISQVVLVEEHDKTSKTELYLISGSAGSGKSVILKRIAWDAALDYGKICLHWDSDEKIDINAILEIADKVRERIYLFVDRAAIHVPDLMLMLKKLRESSLSVTCFVSERTNEWNVECKPLLNNLTDDFSVKYLYPKEIDSLISKLAQHKCLGVLEGKSKTEQISSFSEKAGRQLLVALYEATMSKPFQEIVYDEYRNIVPLKAQLIYKTICVMNRLGVPVRAGIINRIHNVSFEDFKEHFFLPLENIVQTTNYHPGLDHAYEARHPWVAETVFTHAIKDENEKFDLFISLLDALDIGYSADRTAFRELIKYRSLSELFGDPAKIDKIYDKAYLTCGDDDYYYQQRAIFNMKSIWKRFSVAEELLNLAKKYGAHNKSISHTWAELELVRANNSTGLEREKFLKKATELATKLSGKNSDSSHGHDTLCKISLISLKEALDVGDDELIIETTKNAEKIISEALQAYPDDHHLLSEEARLASMLIDSIRAEKALTKAFNANPSNGYLGASLSNIYLSQGDIKTAKEILEKLISINPSDKTAHAKLAKILSKYETEDRLNAEYHWQRSFTDGDTNYLNQLWYARQLYLNDKFEDYLKIIQKLKEVRMSPFARHKLRGVIEANDKSILLVGNIVLKEATYALITPRKYRGTHFLHKANCPRELWDDMKVESEIQYCLGFTFSGAAAMISSTKPQNGIQSIGNLV
jgi:tetratricopeptide (TPR) repeat protein